MGCMDTHTETDEEFGPVMRGRTSPLAKKPLQQSTEAPAGPSRRGEGGRRAAKWVLRVLIAVPLVLVLAGVALLLYASAQIDRQQVNGLQASSPQNILITGTDSREGLTREQQNELTTGSQGGNLTDTIFLLQVGGGRTAMLAFPRDLYVTRCDGSRGRINAAVQIGGPGCLVQTITELSGLEISHHLEVNFLGFRDIVDAVGGVEVCLDAPIVDQDSGLDLPAGCQRLDGVEGLGYVRVRKIDNDLQRIKRQQQFVKALASEVLSPAVLANPVRLVETTTTVANAITADTRLGPIDMVRTGWAMRGLANGLDNAYTVPATGAMIGGASVLEISQPAADALFADFDDGALLAAATPAAEALQPGEIEVVVLNGARVAGLAGQVADQLRGQGFVVQSVGNAEAVDTSVIRYPQGERAAAEVLRDRSGRQAELVEDPRTSAVTLVLGREAGQ